MTVTGGVVQVTLADPHGNLATVFTVGATTPVGSMGMWDEYGNTLTTGPGTGALNYGWLGAKERATDTTGLLLMGARLYNPITGLFTSVDPVPGGNTTACAYPQDPVNKTDLDGQKWNWRKSLRSAGSWAWKHKADIALTAAGFVPGLGVAAWAYRAYRVYSAVNKTRSLRAAFFVTRSHRTTRAVSRTFNRGSFSTASRVDAA